MLDMAIWSFLVLLGNENWKATYGVGLGISCNSRAQTGRSRNSGCAAGLHKDGALLQVDICLCGMHMGLYLYSFYRLWCFAGSHQGDIGLTEGL